VTGIRYAFETTSDRVRRAGKPMRPAPYSDFPDDSPRPERRPPPLPITNLPVNAITSDPDPTLEIRTLIEQLQQTARDARTKLREAEQERNDVSSQLERSLVQIDDLRANERELRSHFTEVSTILRERDNAVAAADRSAQAAARAQEELATIMRQRDEAQRQRDEACRQRDDSAVRLDGLTRAYSDSGMRSTEVQKQLATLRQARDTAHAQNLELSDRISALEDEIAELGFQREAAKKTQQQTESEVTEYRREIEVVTSQRDAASGQIEKLIADLDEQRKKFLDLTGQRSAMIQAGSEHAVALGEARAQVASLRQERDAARLLAQAQGMELEKIRAQFDNFRENETKASGEDLAALREKLTAFEAQARQSRHDGQNLRQQLVAMQEKVTTLEVLAEDATAHQEEAEVQLISTAQQAEADRLALLGARQQVEDITRERNSIRAKAEETRLELEAQLVALRTQANGGSGARFAAGDDAASFVELQGRFEKQRLQSIELVAQLESAQRQIREMSASLAEARLQVKFATRASRDAAPASGNVAAATAPSALSLAELLTPMRECFAAYAQNPGQLGLLFELHDRIVTYAERARLTNCIALYRLAHVFAGLLESLAAAPGQANASTLNTIAQAVEFFAGLRDESAPQRFRDPAKARVLVVDDDAGNCQCVQLVMQEQMIQTATSQDPSAALLELASESFDLIFLDVNMPHMNGFELCQGLRELPLHAATPVVFLTGLATEEMREQSFQSGGNDFLGKPFNLHELTVKALTLILKTQGAAA